MNEREKQLLAVWASDAHTVQCSLRTPTRRPDGRRQNGALPTMALIVDLAEGVCLDAGDHVTQPCREGGSQYSSSEWSATVIHSDDDDLEEKGMEKPVSTSAAQWQSPNQGSSPFSTPLRERHEAEWSTAELPAAAISGHGDSLENALAGVDEAEDSQWADGECVACACTNGETPPPPVDSPTAFKMVWLRLRGFWVDPEDRANLSIAGICSFPGCALREKHAGLHECKVFDSRRKRARTSRGTMVRDDGDGDGDDSDGDDDTRSSSSRDILFWPCGIGGLLNGATGVLGFSERPPYGVISPPEAAAILGESLCCMRGALRGDRLHALTEELIGSPKLLPWGYTGSAAMTRSRKKMIWLDASARMRAEELLSHGPNAVPRSELAAAMDADTAASTTSSICDTSLAEELAASFGVRAPPIAFQPNYAHSDFPMHYDVPDSDGFGEAIITLNVKEAATVLIDETLDRPEHRWQLPLNPGDAYCLRGYARERCSHGVAVGFALDTACQPGCRQCRISLNLRCGVHRHEDAQRIQRYWLDETAVEATSTQHGGGGADLAV